MRTIASILIISILALGCRQSDQKPQASRTEKVNQQLVAAPGPSIENIQPRPWPEQVRQYPNVGIGHPVLYIRDPFEVGQPWANVSNDGYFRTASGENYLLAAADPFIYLGEVVATPFYMAVRPPWQYECSRSGYPVQEPAYVIPAGESGATRNEPDGIDYRGCCAQKKKLTEENEGNEEK